MGDKPLSLKDKFNALSAVAYYIALPFLYLLSILPFPILYFISDGVYTLLYYVIGYRKKVVMTNLKNSFPNKTENELKRLQKDFYHYLCDLFLETFKTLTISKKAMIKHLSFTPETLQMLDRYVEEKKSTVVVLGHLGNWEWACNSAAIYCKQKEYVIYHPLSNKQFDGLMYSMRSRFGAKLIAMKDTIREMLGNRSEVSITMFVSDQTPAPESAYWTNFMNQDTPVFRGIEKIARKLNYPVIYANMKRIKRGYYVLQGETIVEEPVKTKDDEITEMHTRLLERDIMAQPEIWLWSHRRWKHKRPVS